MTRILIGFLLLGTVLLAGCGFQLRGEALLPFERVYVAASDASGFAPLLRNALNAQGKLVEQAQGAPVTITVVDEQRAKEILSLSGGGKVKEYRLIYRVTLRVTDAEAQPLAAPINLQQIREFTYEDSLVLAKEAEEAALNRAMEQETLRQALRRLSYVKR
jgi:LPS-assembly lipoprotein